MILKQYWPRPGYCNAVIKPIVLLLWKHSKEFIMFSLTMLNYL